MILPSITKSYEQCRRVVVAIYTRAERKVDSVNRVFAPHSVPPVLLSNKERLFLAERDSKALYRRHDDFLERWAGKIPAIKLPSHHSIVK